MSLSLETRSRRVPEIDRARFAGDRARRLEGAGYRPPPVTFPAPLQFVILLVASWIGRRQGEAIEYLRAENRVLRARLGPKRLRFVDAERRLLAEKGKPLGRKLLADVASLATPETILRWYREQVAAKYDGSRTRGRPGRPATRGDKV
jgi:putative transposase